ncbi:MAG: DUF1016 domain-containing protein [Candidatus Brocadiae bacterium]|nr:DUF1016 domain-containing protein [Candidatus Brocadiia bacterium]
MKTKIIESSYIRLLSEIKKKIQEARNQAYLAVNKKMILLYWEIGQMIAEKQKAEGWGTKVIQRLADDLSKDTQDCPSFSVRNLKYMLKLYKTYLDFAFVQRLVAQIPWGQNISIMEKVKSHEQREFYLKACIENAWTRPVLIHQIESGLYERDSEENKQHNFHETLPEDLAEQAKSALKDSFNLGFLGLNRTAKEREIESAIVAKIRDVLLELGQWFAFIGSQYKVTVGNRDYFIDLLFYHRVLRSLIAIELKAVEFEPEFVGKMDFYLTALDSYAKLPEENPSIGIILCKSKDRMTVEFALRCSKKPTGVAEYYLTKKLPKQLQGKLPTVRQIEKKLKNIELEKKD